jgi:hypothetical protein
MPEYLTINQAAARLGISERTLRKRISKGEIKAEKEPLEAGGMAWRVWLDGGAPEIAPEAERKENHRTGSAPEVQSPIISEPETAPEVSEPRAGSEPEAGLIIQLRDENAFLRAQIDAWRLQAEAANRSAADNAALLKKALDAMPKALPDASTPNAEKTGRENAPQAPIIAPGDISPVAQKQAAQRKVKPWQKVIMRMIGAR